MTKRVVTNTPIPTTSIEFAATIARIDDRTRQIKDVDLPRVEVLATEARDGVMGLDGRVGSIERHPHECDEKDRQAKQDIEIIEGKEIDVEHTVKIDGLYRLRNWFFGVIGTVIGAALVFAATTITTETMNRSNIERNKENIDRQEKVIADLPRKQDLKLLRQEVKGIPAQVKTKIEESNGSPTAEEVSNAAEELPLKSYELKQLNLILDRAEKREQKTKRNVKGALHKHKITSPTREE